MNLCAKSAPDGYTLCFVTSDGMAVLPALGVALPFDAEKDFEPVALLGFSKPVLVASAQSPFDGFAGLSLNALDQFRNFLGGLRGFLRQFSYFIGNNREAKSMLPGTGGLNGGVESEEVGLLGEVVNDFDDLADIISTLAKGIDNFPRRSDGCVDPVQSVGGLLHGRDAAMDFLTRTIGNIEQHFGSVSDSLNGGHHLVNGSGGFTYA